MITGRSLSGLLERSFKGPEPNMNFPRHVNMTMPGACRRVPVSTHLLLTTLLYLFCLLFNPIILSILHAGEGRQPQSPPALSDPTDRNLQNTHFIPSACLSGPATLTDSIASVVQGLFLLPADSETTDTESEMARLTNPFLLIPSFIARTSRRPVAARQLSSPLYLYYQSLLC